ncbi:MAG: PDZ domain-containing protein, partial [Caldilineaceae bacterium]|nr:PDZ domain-containing protein [Caldilineaceae bacterium]
TSPATPAPSQEEAAPAAPEATPEAGEEAAPDMQDDGTTTPDVMPHFGMMSGAVVGRVVEDSPASDAGIRTGDVIVAVDGTTVDAENDLASLIGAHAPGDEVEITLVDWRSGDEFSVMVTLGENPDAAGAPFLGVSYMPLDMEQMMPRYRGGQDDSGDNGGSDNGDGTDAMPPFFHHRGMNHGDMDMQEFMQRLGCDAENADEMPPYCHMFDVLPQGEGE